MTRYFPERHAVVLYVDVAAMRSSGILNKLVGSTVGEEAEYRQFVEGTGFNYKNDLHKVMLNSANGLHYFLLQGRFDWDKLRDWAQKQKNGKCDDELCSFAGSTPDRIVSFRRLQKNLMALATTRDTDGARAVERRGVPASGADLSVPGEPVWLLLPSEAIRALPSYPSGTRLFAKALESADKALFTLGPDSAQQFQLNADVLCHSPEDAAVLKAQLEGITQLLQKLIAREAQSPSAGDLSGMLTSGTFTREGNHVKARWPVPKTFLESLGS